MTSSFKKRNEHSLSKLIVSVRKICSNVISFIKLEATVCKVETEEVGAWKGQNDSLKSCWKGEGLAGKMVRLFRK